MHLRRALKRFITKTAYAEPKAVMQNYHWSRATSVGFSRILIPAANLKAVNPHHFTIQLVPCRRVEDAFRALFG